MNDLFIVGMDRKIYEEFKDKKDPYGSLTLDHILYCITDDIVQVGAHLGDIQDARKRRLEIIDIFDVPSDKIRIYENSGSVPVLIE
jgi:hypothetical protein